jgi:uncharacterized protein (TIGR03437 family)
MRTKTSILFAAGLLAVVQTVHAQSILNTNLIVNPGAESGPSATDISTPVSSIPGWTTVSGKPTVLAYNSTGYVQLTDPAPQDHGGQYFAPAVSSTTLATLSQTISVSAAASSINTGNIEFTASAYLGSVGSVGEVSQGPTMVVAFQNSGGQLISSTPVGPIIAGSSSVGMFLQQQIGLVPVGTTQVVVTLKMNYIYTYQIDVADSLSLVLSQAGSTPALGTNLVVNPGAELGPSAVLPTPTLYIPGWSTSSPVGSVAPYGGSDWISTTDPGPPNRGASLFCGWQVGSNLFQDIDVSAAASLIDAGQVTFVVSGWLGGASGPGQAANLTYAFFDWSGKQLAPTGQLTVGSFNGYSLYELEDSGAFPAGARRVRITLNFAEADSLADNIYFALSAPTAPPVLYPGGIVSASAFGGFASISPGSWIEIYGANLSSGAPQQWSGSEFMNGVAPTSVGGVSVTVGGVAAFIDYVSSGQIDALVPSNTSTGAQSILVMNSNGMSDAYSIQINQTEPGLLAPSGTFVINNKQYVAGMLSDGSFALPANAIPGVASRPANPGETVVFYGIGFGPTLPDFPAGTVVTQQNELATPIQFLFNTTSVTPAYWGLAPNYTGLYQFNVVVPNIAANNALPLSFNLGGVKGTQTLYIAVN